MFAYSVTALAKGCSLRLSRAAAIPNKKFSSAAQVMMSVTKGLPSVKVPVLSKITVSILCAVSKASPDLIKMPFSAPLPVPTIIATGVAKPNAHGQLITKIETAIEKANSTLAPLISQQLPAISAITITAGTKTPATLSAVLAMGALLALASSTSAIILLIVVSPPTLSARNFTKPLLFSVPLVTESPTVLFTGRLSPVIALSSIVVSPSRIIPSAAKLSPGLTKISSPITKSSTAIVISSPPRRTVACFGARFMSFSTACEVLPLARASKYLPTVISVTIVPADSKYKLRLYSSTNAKSPAPSP